MSGMVTPTIRGSGSGDLGNIADALARKVLLRKLHLHIKKGINLSGMPSTAGVEKTRKVG